MIKGWEKCALCQTDGEKLRDLLRNIDSYSKLAANIKSFIERNLSLAAKCTSSLNELKWDSDIASNRQTVKAKWHKRCALKISAPKLKKGFVS